MIPALTPDVLEIMESVYYRPAISIILPFEPKMSPKWDLTQSLKLSGNTVDKYLRDNYPPETVSLMMGKLETIISNINFSTHKKSIAIYLSPVFEKVLYLNIPVEPKIIVDGSFRIRDVVMSKKQLLEYLVLVVGEKECEMYACKDNTFLKIVSSTPVPHAEVLNNAPEKVSDFPGASGRRQDVLNKLLRRTDDSLGIILQAYRVPLLVTGSKKVLGHFKKITKHDHAVVEYIPASYHNLTPEKMAEVMQPYTDQWSRILERDLIRKVQHAAGEKRLAAGMRNVWKEAPVNNGSLLVLEREYRYPAQAENNDNVIYMPSKKYNRFTHVKDTIDDVLEKVLQNGGDVEFVGNGMLKDYQQIALIKYF